MQYEEYQESLLTYIEVKEVAKTAEDDGRKKEKISIAQKLKLMGLSKMQIQEATGLSDEDIEAL
jgi:predicted transposase YdaD